eukprot:7827394-Lingulodinium_polyedra.AAC.1
MHPTGGPGKSFKTRATALAEWRPCLFKFWETRPIPSNLVTGGPLSHLLAAKSCSWLRPSLLRCASQISWEPSALT